MPTVSVIIPTHNRPYLLARALASVAAQTFKDFEILVVQNGGTRDSEAVAERFKQEGVPVRYLYEPKACPVNARNVGIQASTGSYIAFLDDDDEWLPNKLEYQIKALQQDSKLGLVTCGGWFVNHVGKVLRETLRYKGPLTFETLVTEGCKMGSLSAVIIKKECFDQVGLLNPRFSIANDYDLYLRLIRSYSFGWVGEPLFRYYLHQKNLSADLGKMWDETIAVLKSLVPSLDSETARGLVDKAIQKVIAGYARGYYAAATTALDEKSYSMAAGYFFFSVRHDPWIGNKVSWSRFSNPFYRVLRPYGALLYCGWRSLLNSDQKDRMFWGVRGEASS